MLWRVFILLVLFSSGNSCQKELSCEDCVGSNRIPHADAGADLSVQLPADSAVLNGSASDDPDGRIVSWLWRKIYGPDPSLLVAPKDSISTVRGLSVGRYVFELTVTDNGGLSALDTVEVFVNDPLQPNRPPNANAGRDTTLILPVNSLFLDGGLSSDPDNNISEYRWLKISGPALYNLVDGKKVRTHATELTLGTYEFQLQVIDSGGLYDLDTIQISVKNVPDPVVQVCGDSGRSVIKARLVPFGKLSQARQYISVASAGGKILFAGGVDGNFDIKSDVDIYDIASNIWSNGKLCIPRFLIASVSSGNKIFFAGGEVSDGTWPIDSVDIYDVVSDTWSVTHLSTAGHSIAASAVGDKVLFAGGDGGFVGPGRETRVDIYSLSSGKWTRGSLSDIKRGGHNAVSFEGKVYISGGNTWDGLVWSKSDIVDIYDESTGSWSSMNMVEKKLGLAGISASGKIFWAGGSSCLVEVFDVRSGISTVNHLFDQGSWWPTDGQQAVQKNNKLIFFRHNEDDNRRFDIYDLTTGIWSIGEIDQNIRHSSIISVNNEIYVAGGQLNGVVTSQIWKLEF